MENVNGTRKVFMKRQQEQYGMALLEIVLLVALVAIIALAGIYVKNRSSSKGSTQASSSSVSYKKIATTNQGTATAIEASINGAAADESQAEQQSENSQAGVAKTDSSDANNFGDSVNENAIGF